VREASGGWDPKNQRAELFGLLNTRIRAGEHLRVFPISNFTEVDVWEYIRAEGLEVPSIYFAHTREVFERDGLLQAAAPFVERLPSERIFSAQVRFRTVGDMTCTGAIRSSARDVDAILDEIRAATITERGATRADDRFSEAAMEDRKREGYF